MHTILVADDHEIVRSAIRQIISLRKDLILVAEADNGLSTIAEVKLNKPNLLILDVSMPHANALEVVIEAKRWSPTTRTLIFTGVKSGTIFQDLLDAGVSALVLKSDNISFLEEAIDDVLKGKQYISDSIDALKNSALQFDSLTDREKQILKFIAHGKSNSFVAEILSISPKTVENHRSNLMKKLNLHSVSELMAYAYKEGLMAPELDM